jgi:hypothetical protein
MAVSNVLNFGSRKLANKLGVLLIPALDSMRKAGVENEEIARVLRLTADNIDTVIQALEGDEKDATGGGGVTPD